MSESNPTIIVRRRWDDADSARIALRHVRELAIKDQPGGICSPIPRPFLFARVWCDHLIEGAPIHACDSEPLPTNSNSAFSSATTLTYTQPCARECGADHRRQGFRIDSCRLVVPPPDPTNNTRNKWHSG
jgi:hypothetical protein